MRMARGRGGGEAPGVVHSLLVLLVRHTQPRVPLVLHITSEGQDARHGLGWLAHTVFGYSGRAWVEHGCAINLYTAARAVGREARR